MIDNKHGMTGQKNASKEITKSSRIYIRCTPEEKALWASKAKSEKLSSWACGVLNKAP